ncbi:MAG: cytochrome c [Deltaproteobacteria bacterium]|nr:MAG: cytochrome c [Deltaproteobacteria bacterium]
MRTWQYPERWRTTRAIPEITMRAVEEGRKNYATYCAACHGPNGRGSRDGQGYFAPALNNPEFLAAASDGFLLATIARGREGTPMRPFGEGAGGIVSLSTRQISDIVSFIRSWQHPARSSVGGKNHEKI